MKRTFLSDTLRYDYVITIDGIRFTLGVAKPGKGFSFILHEPLSYSEFDSCHYQDGGSLIGPVDRWGGWKSEEDIRKLPRGVVSFTAVETANLWCATSSPYAKSVKCVTGDVNCVAGDKLLHLTGINKGKLFRVTSQKTVSLGTVVAFKWNPIGFAPVETADLQWETIKFERERKKDSGFTWNGLVFDSDAAARTNIMDAAMGAMLNSSATYEWTLKDNSVVTLSASDMIQVANALGQHIQVVYAEARAARDALNTQ